MKLTKYIVLVDDEGGPLARLVPRLRELDFLVMRVAEPSAVLELVRAFPKLSLVAIRPGGDAAATRQLLSDIRQVQPGLPLLWHGPEGSLPAGHHAELLPFESVTAGDIVAHAERLLHQHCYPADFSTYLAETVVGSFAAFGTHAASTDPFIKASHAQLADLSAVITFSSPNVSGHLVVSASRDAALNAYVRVMGEAAPRTDDDLAGLLGECANRVIGRLSAYFEQRGASLIFGVPLYLVGEQSIFWQGQHRAALAMEFETVHGRLFAELCMAAIEPPPPAPSERSSFDRWTAS